MQTPEQKINEIKRIVIKVGSSTLNHENGGLCPLSLAKLVGEIAALREAGFEPVVVSSGAVAAGMGILDLDSRPRKINERQATAAVGQGYLIQRYNEELAHYNLVGAQVLLTRTDLADRERYSNAQNTLDALLKKGVVPIINENDTVVVEELCFGDNDRLSALVACLVDAQLLVIFSDVDGFYDANPQTNHNAVVIPQIEDITEEIEKLAGGSGSSIGTGGMSSKLQAAKIVTGTGIGMLILNGSRPEELKRFLSGTSVGTYFLPRNGRLPSRKRWLAWGAISEGTIQVDMGAKAAILDEGKSLLPSGVVKQEGSWERGHLVKVIDQDGDEIARGLALISSKELAKCKGLHSEEAAAVIGMEKACEVIHRDCLTITK